MPKTKGDSVSRRVRGIVAALRGNAANVKRSRDPEELKRAATFVENCAWHLRDIAREISASSESPSDKRGGE